MRTKRCMPAILAVRAQGEAAGGRSRYHAGAETPAHSSTQPLATAAAREPTDALRLRARPPRLDPA